MKILAAAIVALYVLTVPLAPVAAQFEFVEEVVLEAPGPRAPDTSFAVFGSVAFDGEFYWATRFNRTILQYDVMFKLIEVTELPRVTGGPTANLFNFGNPRSLDVDRKPADAERLD